MEVTRGTSGTKEKMMSWNLYKVNVLLASHYKHQGKAVLLVYMFDVCCVLKFVIYSPDPAFSSCPTACNYDSWGDGPHQWSHSARRSPSAPDSQITPSQRLWWEHQTCTPLGSSAPVEQMVIFIRRVIEPQDVYEKWVKLNNIDNQNLYLFILEVHLILLDHLSTGQAAMIDYGIHVGPGGELPLPVGDGGEGSNNQERALDACSIHLGQQCDGLDGLPQTHLICQNTVLPERRQIQWVRKPWAEARAKIIAKETLYFIHLTCVHLFLFPLCLKVCICPSCLEANLKNLGKKHQPNMSFINFLKDLYKRYEKSGLMLKGSAGQ